MADDRVPAGYFWDVGAASSLDGFYRTAAAHAIDQPHVREP